MPIGIIADALAVILGGALGAGLGHRISEPFKEKLNLIFAICSMGMGVSTIVLMENLPAVVLAIILGGIAGLALHLEEKINAGAALLGRLFPGGGTQSGGDAGALLTVVVLFCASGTGIYGSILAGASGDHSVLLAKAILDLFTAAIFACALGRIVALIALPQFCIFLLLYLLAGWIMPYITPVMLNDFKACGGLIMLATGLRMCGVRPFPIADMLPAMVLVMPFSALWLRFIVPLL